MTARLEPIQITRSPHPVRPRSPLLRAGARVVLLAPLALSVACASMLPADMRQVPATVERPAAAADYDVLVAEFAAREGSIDEAREAYTRAAEKDPGSAFLQRRVALLSAQLEDGDKAIVHALRAVELEPDHEPGRMLLGRLYRMRRDVEGVERTMLDEAGAPLTMRGGLMLVQAYLENQWTEKAILLASRLVRDYPESLEPAFALVSAYERAGNTVGVVETLERAIELHPDQPTLYGRLAQARTAAGDRAGAIDAYTRLLARQPHHYGTLTSLAEAYVRENRLDRASEIYERVVELFPDNEGVIQRLAGIDVQQGRLDAAERRLAEAAARLPDSGDLQYMLGLVRVETGDPRGALSVLDRVPPTHKSYVDARLRIVRIHEEAGDMRRALSVLEELRILSPDREMDFHTAGMRVRNGDFEGGVALVQEWIQKDPKDHEALYQMGIVYDIANRDAEAVQWMRAALDAKPDNAHALNYIGYTYAEQGGDLDEAEALIQRALELEPEDGFITDSLGWVYYQRAKSLVDDGNPHQAKPLLQDSLTHLERANELSGGDPVISEHLGDLHLLMGEERAALGYYEQAVQQTPRTGEQPDLERKLESLRRTLGAR